MPWKQAAFVYGVVHVVSTDHNMDYIRVEGKELEGTQNRVRLLTELDILPDLSMLEAAVLNILRGQRLILNKFEWIVEINF